MKYRINSSELSIEINQTGMELSSIKSLNTNTEYLWQGNPTIWSGQAPVLFPIIGALKDGFMIYKNQNYSIPKHGILRNSSKPVLKESTENSLSFSLVWDDESLKQYPFKFELEIKFTVLGSKIEIAHRIVNPGEETMWYSIGGHPAFNCSVNEGQEYEDYFLEFTYPESDSTWSVESSGLIGKETKSILENSSKLSLHKHLFDNDALIFKNLKSREVTLMHKDRGGILSLKFDDFDYLGIWAKPGAPFVCIEPWLGIADSTDSNQKFEEKEGLLKLEAHQSDVKTYSITILKEK
ncbi:aldose 1-epimerase family protein [Algoriphagus persicinus]|uniref:aldose 1-epimerase family protein n=1 Tax=Algoriphagus persicinus TaxID=3108754 RepID=UPI002B3EA426|nr:aldose 1-epimerase family protein [Algoriphagus sp. E1-3-M2]MEB2784113.1 aldose 1-epimerase family protein [Algoriphagus sp. E1-3-M2]